MFETLRYEANRRVRGTAVLAVAVSVYAVFVVWYFSVLEGVDFEAFLREFPPAMIEAFGLESLSTVEGFLAAQVFNFVWLLALGLYFAYAAGSLVAGDVESKRLDLVLSFPLTRSQLLAETFAALLLPVVVVNAVTGGVVYLAVIAIGESIDPVALALVHLLSVPYLLVCAAIGTVFSVLASRGAVAERAAAGVVFVLYLVEAVVGSSTDFAWVRYVSPTNYYEPTAILVRNTYGLLDVAVLVATFLLLLLVSLALFERRDI